MSTLNQKEVEKFSKLANEWWNENGEFRVLHQINPERLAFIIKQITKSPARILDIGCGGGLVSIPLAKLGHSVTGVDASHENIAVCKLQAAKLELKNANFKKSLVEELPDDKFDLILALEIIEHVDNPDYFLKELAKRLAVGGAMIVSTLNRNLKSLLLAKVAAEYILNIVPKGTHEFSKFIRPEELKAKMALHRLKCVGSNGIGFSLRKNQWHLNDNLSVNYIMAFKGNEGV